MRKGRVGFALVYWSLAGVGGPRIIAYLEKESCGNDLPCLLILLRAVYFSIVTMTTLGFGDMFAAPNHFLGYPLLIGQVLLGYVLLAALVTRIAVLFTTVSPARRTSPDLYVARGSIQGPLPRLRGGAQVDPPSAE